MLVHFKTRVGFGAGGSCVSPTVTVATEMMTTNTLMLLLWSAVINSAPWWEMTRTEISLTAVRQWEQKKRIRDGHRRPSKVVTQQDGSQRPAKTAADWQNPTTYTSSSTPLWANMSSSLRLLLFKNNLPRLYYIQQVLPATRNFRGARKPVAD